MWAIIANIKMERSMQNRNFGIAQIAFWMAVRLPKRLSKRTFQVSASTQKNVRLFLRVQVERWK